MRTALVLSAALCLLIGIAGSFAMPEGAETPLGNSPGHAPRMLIRTSEAALRTLERDTLAGFFVEQRLTETPARVVLRGPHAAALERLATRLTASGLVDYAVPEVVVPMELRGRHVPDDPMFASQWPLENLAPGGTFDADVDAPEAWAVTRGSPDVIIAVLDDGVQTDHPDLAANIRHAGRDFTVASSAVDGNPKSGGDIHGTAVAGIAAARGDNALGISGICPACTILPIRVFRSSNLGTAAAFRYAVEQGADVIVNSWGYTREPTFAADDAVADAIEQAATEGRRGRGAIVVFGVTNEAVDNCRGPDLDISSLDSVIAVGVSDHDDQIGGSGYGECLDLVAPAKPRFRRTIGVVTTDRTGPDGHVDGAYFSSFGGTSAAAPLVGGVAALLVSLNPELTRTEVQRILEHTADKIDAPTANYDDEGFSPVAGHGRLNAAQALVPTVHIRASPSVVATGEPFDLTVTASAPFGVGHVAWRGRDTPAGQYEWREDVVDDGRAYYRRTWTGLRLAEPGTFRFEALVRDAADGDTNDAYPHVGRTNPDLAAGLVTVTAGGR